MVEHGAFQDYLFGLLCDHEWLPHRVYKVSNYPTAEQQMLAPCHQ